MLIFKKEWRETRWTLAVGIILLTVFVAWQIGFYWWSKSIDLTDLPDELIAQLGMLKIDYLVVVSQWFEGALLYISLAFAILLGAASMGRERSRETLCLLLAKPLHRRDILIQKYAALATGLLLLIHFPSVFLLISGWLQGEPVMIIGLLGAGTQVFAAALVVLSFAFLLSVVISDQMKATSAALGITFLLALLNSNQFTAGFSPFHYISPTAALQGEALVWISALALLLASLIVVALTAFYFQRQDI